MAARHFGVETASEELLGSDSVATDAKNAFVNKKIFHSPQIVLLGKRTYMTGPKRVR